MVYADRLLPQDIDAEESVIGSLLLDGDALWKVAHNLGPNDFYRQCNAWCYAACVALASRAEAIKQITVAHELSVQERLADMGGMPYLSHLVSIVPSPVHIEYYAKIVSLTATQRRLIESAGAIAEIGYRGDADTDSLLAEAEAHLARLRASAPSKERPMSLREIADEHLVQLDAGTLALPQRGIDTGFVALDQLTHGLQPSDLVVLAARPSIGKTALALNIGVNAAKDGRRVLVFSMEMPKKSILNRMIAAEAGVDTHNLAGNLLTHAQEQAVMDVIGLLSDLPVHVDDTAVMTVEELRAKAMRHHLEVGVDLVVVDYMQLLNGRRRQDGNRVQEMSEISRSLKGVARDLDVPMLALSQLNRAVEGRNSHRPMLFDLRESGSIEQDSDVVMFLSREAACYTRESWEHNNPGQPYPEGLTELVVAKNRNGPIGTVQLNFEADNVRFSRGVGVS